jgi:hypothetical protein
VILGKPELLLHKDVKKNKITPLLHKKELSFQEDHLTEKILVFPCKLHSLLKQYENKEAKLEKTMCIKTECIR